MFRLILFCFHLCLCLYGNAQSFAQSSGSAGLFHSYQGGDYGSGVNFADFDLDGWDDITFCQNNGNPVFYKNINGSFYQQSPFVQTTGQMKSTTWVDYDNDGDKDLFITFKESQNRLFRNNGNMNFTDVTVSAGFSGLIGMSGGAAWADYDRDGDLDVYVSNYDGPNIGNPAVTNWLFRNNGDGTFTETAAQAGVDNGNRYSFQGLWMDYNNDLWPDLFVINDRLTMDNYLYENNGDGTFTDVSIAAGIDYGIFSMSDTGEDFDHDGDIDVYITNNPGGNLFHRNNGDGTFDEIAEEAGVIMNQMSWGANFFDADNDTWSDLYVCSTPFWNEPGADYFYRNEGDGTFIQYNTESGISGDQSWSHSSAAADYNRDGFVDLVVTCTSPNYSMLFRNIPGSGFHWLFTDLVGVESNRDGISSWIDLYYPGGEQHEYTYLGEGYMNQNSHSEHFGLGELERVDSLRVRWISGQVDTWYHVVADQRLTLTEGTGFKAVITSSLTGMPCPGQQVTLDAGEFAEYLWNTGDTTRYITATEPGLYEVLVTTPNGLRCYSDLFELNYATSDAYNILSTNVSCFGAQDGGIEVALSAEASGDILWQGMHVGLQIEGLAAGTYDFHYSDSYGCTYPQQVTITEPEALSVQVVKTDALCAGGTGSAQVEVSGGTAPYAENWDGADPTALPSGIHHCTITDANGCELQTQFEVLQPDSLSAGLDLIHPLCFGESGSASISPAGGTEPYIIDWLGSDPLNLPAGEHSALVTDAHACTEEIGFSIIEPDVLSGSASTSPQFENGENGNIWLEISGGTPPYELTWSTGEEGSQSVSDLIAGEYWVSIEDSLGCQLYMEFTIDFVAGITEWFEHTFEIYPNPASSHVWLHLPEGGWDLTLLDSQGRLMLQEKNKSGKLYMTTAELAPGVYVLTISKDQEQRTGRLLVSPDN